MAVQPYSPEPSRASGRPVAAVSGVRRHVLQRYLVAYLFILPVLLLYLIFVLRPTLQTFWLAFYEWNGISIDREWVGLANFQRLARRSDLLAGAAAQPDLDGRGRRLQPGGRADRGGAPRQQHPGSPHLPARLLPAGGPGLDRHRHDLALDLRADRCAQYRPGGPRAGIPGPRLARRFHRRPAGPGHRLELDDLRSERRHPAGRDAEHRPDALRRGPRRRRRVRRGCSSTSPSPRCGTRSPS